MKKHMAFPEAIRTVCGFCGFQNSLCRTCRLIRLMEAYDTDQASQRTLELIRTMTIQKHGPWYLGVIGGHPFEVKVTERDTEYGILGGRIIKLFVMQKPSDTAPGREELLSFERGWGKLPGTSEENAIVDALYEYFEQRMDEEVP